MTTKIEIRRIIIFLAFAFGIAWSAALVIYLTGGLVEQPADWVRVYPGAGADGNGLHVGARPRQYLHPPDHARGLERGGAASPLQERLALLADCLDPAIPHDRCRSSPVFRSFSPLFRLVLINHQANDSQIAFAGEFIPLGCIDHPAGSGRVAFARSSIPSPPLARNSAGGPIYSQNSCRWAGVKPCC